MTIPITYGKKYTNHESLTHKVPACCILLILLMSALQYDSPLANKTNAHLTKCLQITSVSYIIT